MYVFDNKIHYVLRDHPLPSMFKKLESFNLLSQYCQRLCSDYARTKPLFELKSKVKRKLMLNRLQNLSTSSIKTRKSKDPL